MKKWWRNSYWFVSGFVKKYKRQLLGSFLLAVVMVFVMIRVLPKLPQQKKNLYVGVVGRYTLNQLPVDVERSLGPGLTTLDEKLRPAPGVAEKWEIEDEGKLYRFYLKNGMKWSDGEEIKAEDLEFSVPNVEITTDENKILFKLPDAFAPFAALLNKPLIKEGVYTAGKYSIEDLSVDGPFLARMVLNSEEEKLIYEFYPTLSQAILAFKLGKVDEIDGLMEKTDLADWPNVELKEEVKYDKYVAVFYNFDDPVVGGPDQKVRQALSYLIEDKDQGNKRALSPIDPRSWAYNPAVKPYDYDFEHAKSLGGEVLKDGVVIELSTLPELLNLADKIKADWEKIGIEVKIKVVSGVPTDYQAWLGVQDIPTDPDQYTIWHSTQTRTNFTHFNDEKIDQILEDGRRTIKQEERKQTYFDFQRFLLEEAPATFLYHPRIYSLRRK